MKLRSEQGVSDIDDVIKIEQMANIDDLLLVFYARIKPASGPYLYAVFYIQT